MLCEAVVNEVGEGNAQNTNVSSNARIIYNLYFIPRQPNRHWHRVINGVFVGLVGLFVSDCLVDYALC